ncbi:uncharacterized protein LOC144441178 isoform X2 [Glandiceps talaboti]
MLIGNMTVHRYLLNCLVIFMAITRSLEIQDTNNQDEIADGEFRDVDEAIEKDGLHEIKLRQRRQLFQRYQWVQGDFTQCPVTCGFGMRSRILECLDVVTQDIVNNSMCEENGMVKPRTEMAECSEGDCPGAYAYSVGIWEECSNSTTCGEGIQYRNVTCHDILEPNIGDIVNNSFCEELELNTPAMSRPCQNESTCPFYEYVTDPWTQCSVTCGEGMQYRNVSCLDLSTESLNVVHESFCDEEWQLNKPNTSRPCQNISFCPEFHYDTSMWSECSVSCGDGNRVRTVRCIETTEQSQVLDELCSHDPKPTSIEDCNLQTCPTDGTLQFDYITGSWEICDCVIGIQRRTVYCVHLGSGNLEIYNDTQCALEGIFKPDDSRVCPRDECPGVWHVTEWSECSATCGNGTQNRHLYCILQTNERILLDEKNCNLTAKPHDTDVCMLENCPTRYSWLPSEWGNCNVSCGTGVQTRQVACYSVFEGVVEEVDSQASCPSDDKPPDTQMCVQESCNGVWITGPWAECPKTCGQGYQIRYVTCQPEDDNLPTVCEESSRPTETKDCYVECVEPENPCQGDPCQNGGTCIVQGQQYLCSCGAGWTGPTCEIAVACSDNPCENGGTCSLENESISCRCLDGWSGLRCEIDIENPVLHVCPSDITIYTPEGKKSAKASWNEPFTTDNSGDVSTTSSHRPGSSFVIGETEITYTAIDAAGNFASCPSTFTVTVKDGEKPLFQDCPGDIKRGITTDQSGVLAKWSPPTATDNSGSVIVTSTHNPLDYFPKGVTRVVYTATDPSANTNECSFNIFVESLEEFPEGQQMRMEVTLDIEFTVGLSDKSSIEFNVLATDVETAIAVLLQGAKIEGFNLVAVTNFRSGSVIADMVVVFHQLVDESVYIPSLQAVYPDVDAGYIGNYVARDLKYQSPEGTEVVVNWCYVKPCPEYMNCTTLADKCVAHCDYNTFYCRHGSQCSADVTNDLIQCRCSSNYYGVRCEVTDIVNDAEAATIIASFIWVGLLGTVSLLLSLAFLRRCCCKEGFRRNFTKNDFLREDSAFDSPFDDDELTIDEDMDGLKERKPSNFILASKDETRNVEYRTESQETEDVM